MMTTEVSKYGSTPPSVRNPTGKNLRHDRRAQAVDIGRPHTKPDEREHVGAAPDDRLPASLEEGAASPEDHRRGENQLNPARDRAWHKLSQSIPHHHLRHSQDEYRQPEGRAPKNRRVMSTSSGLGGSSRLTTLGSRAIPQIGHEPGPSCTTSGCMGQVWGRALNASASAEGRVAGSVVAPVAERNWSGAFSKPARQPSQQNR